MRGRTRVDVVHAEAADKALPEEVRGTAGGDDAVHGADDARLDPAQLLPAEALAELGRDGARGPIREQVDRAEHGDPEGGRAAELGGGRVLVLREEVHAGARRLGQAQVRADGLVHARHVRCRLSS